MYWFDEPAPARSDVSYLLIQMKLMLKALDGRATGQQAIMIDSHPGLAVRIEVGEFIYSFRLYVVEGRFYEVSARLSERQYIGNQFPTHEQQVRTGLFLDSFDLQ